MVAAVCAALSAALSVSRHHLARPPRGIAFGARIVNSFTRLDAEHGLVVGGCDGAAWSRPPRGSEFISDVCSCSTTSFTPPRTATTGFPPARCELRCRTTRCRAAAARDDRAAGTASSKFAEAEKWAQKIVDSGQASADARRFLDAAKKKRLPDDLRRLIEPPKSKSTPAKGTP